MAYPLDQDRNERKVSERRREQKKAYKALLAAGKPATAKAVEEEVDKKVKSGSIKDVAEDIVLIDYYPTFSSLGMFSPGIIFSNVSFSISPLKLAPELTIVTAITGWRRWTVDMFGVTLKSNNGEEWKPFEKLTARCIKGSGGLQIFGFQIPECRGIYCDCGIYAYKDRFSLQFGENSPTLINHVWGEVYLWGRVVEHSGGWRAQYAYPKSFVNSGGIARQLAEAYGVQLISGEPNVQS